MNSDSVHRFNIGDMVMIEPYEDHGLIPNNTEPIYGLRAIIRERKNNFGEPMYVIDIDDSETAIPSHYRRGWWVYDKQCSAIFIGAPKASSRSSILNTR